jgi:hypothetical protein
MHNTALITRISRPVGLPQKSPLDNYRNLHSIKRPFALLKTDCTDHLSQSPHARTLSMRLNYADLNYGANQACARHRAKP